MNYDENWANEQQDYIDFVFNCKRDPLETLIAWLRCAP